MSAERERAHAEAPVARPRRAERSTTDGAQIVYLHPGQLFASAEPSVVTTILGSCVSVCLYDAARGIGGLNHFLLPHWAGGEAASPRFGNVAITTLVERLGALGAPRSSLRAKLFGGACVTGAAEHRPDHLGAKNAACATTILGELGIPILPGDLGGRRGRKLVFHTADGTALVKDL